jgi:hypothetical protein
MGEKKAVNCLVLCDECSVTESVELKINQDVKYQNFKNKIVVGVLHGYKKTE